MIFQYVKLECRKIIKRIKWKFVANKNFENIFYKDLLELSTESINHIV